MWTVRAGESHLFPLTGLSADQGAAEDVSTAVISPGDGSRCSTAAGSLTGMADGPGSPLLPHGFQGPALIESCLTDVRGFLSLLFFFFLLF